MSIAIISHPECELHDPGPGHPEQGARVSVIQQALKTFPFKPPVQFYEAPLANKAQLLAVHPETYIDWIFSIAPKGDELIAIDADTIMNQYTLNAALRAAGAVILAVDLVLQGNAQAVFCNVRPPGHHAEREKAMGFCFFNNVAVGVMYAKQHYGLKRIAIVDFDVHHGNGTQDIFQKNKNVLYCSSFEYPFYPGYEPEMDSAHILSIPLPAGTGGGIYREKVRTHWLNQIASFQPELIFFSAGFDAHAADPLADLVLEKDDYVWLTKAIAQIAKAHCQGRMISVLEGGYNLDALAACVPFHVDALKLEDELVANDSLPTATDPT